MNQKTAEIRELWERVCLRNDAAAFDALFSLCYHKLLHFCLLYVQRKEPAEEVVSDVFVRCWINRENLSHVQNPEVYLFVSVKNQSLNYLKRFSNVHLVSIGEVNTDDMVNALDPEKETEQRELSFLINQAISLLPRQCQIIFRLIKEDGMKYKEVAEILQLSPRTVETQLFRAISKLRLSMQPYLAARRGIKSSPGAGKDSGTDGRTNSPGLPPTDGILVVILLIFFTHL